MSGRAKASACPGTNMAAELCLVTSYNFKCLFFIFQQIKMFVYLQLLSLLPHRPVDQMTSMTIV